MTKRTIQIILGVVVIAIIAIVILIVSKHPSAGTSQNNTAPTATGQVIDASTLTQVPVADRDNRYRLLVDMIETNTANYAQNQTFQLNDSDPSSKVMIGAYKADSLGKDGGIVMLQPLGNGKYSIDWEISSPMFTSSPSGVKLKAINRVGSKELITFWNNQNLGNNQNIVTEYWIFSLDPANKTYEVLNSVVDKDGNPIVTSNFATLSPNGHFNRWQATPMDPSDAYNIFQDVDGDGIPEVVINTPALEFFDVIPTSPDMIGKGRDYSQIYKWNGSQYYLWKEVVNTSTND